MNVAVNVAANVIVVTVDEVVVVFHHHLCLIKTTIMGEFFPTLKHRLKVGLP